MKIVLSKSFQKDILRLDAARREQVCAVLLALPEAFRDPTRHLGPPLRRLHPSGLWEARIGLGLRVIVAVARGAGTLVRVAGHDEVRRFLRTL